MKPHTHARPSLPGAIGMQSAWLSVATGSVSLIVAMLLWWQNVPHEVARVGQHAGIFSALLGLMLALVPTAVYDFYDGYRGLTALEDQQIAGLTMSAEEAVGFFAVFAYYFAQFAREQA